MVEVLTPVPLKLREIYPEEEVQKEVIFRLVDQEKERFLKAYRGFIPRDLVSELEDITDRTELVTDEAFSVKREALSFLLRFALQAYHQHRLSEEGWYKLLMNFDKIAGAIPDDEPTLGAVVGRWPLLLNKERLREQTIEKIELIIDHELVHACDHRQRHGSIFVHGGFRQIERQLDQRLIVRNRHFYEWLTEVLSLKVDNPELIPDRPLRKVLDPGEFFVFMAMSTGVTALGDPRVLEKAYFQGETGPFLRAIDLYYGRGKKDILEKVFDYIGDSSLPSKPMSREEAKDKLFGAMEEIYGDDTFSEDYADAIELQALGGLLKYY